MSGISIGHPHPRPCSGGKTLRRCRNNADADNVILIDVDSENFDNVIIIDVPESLRKKLHGSRQDKKRSHRNVIFIDDDDDDDDDGENPDDNHSIGVNNVNSTTGASSSRNSHPVAKHSVDAVEGECEFVQVNVTPVRLSKCKRTYSGKASTRNHYGLDTDSENDSSANDFPDCELVEDSSGEVQEQWEKAFTRRRKDINSNTSQVNKEDCSENVEAKDETRPHKEGASSSNTENFNNENDVPSPHRTEHYSDSEWASIFDYDTVDDFFVQSTPERHLNDNKSGDHPTPSFRDEETPILQPCTEERGSCADQNSSYGKSCPLEDEATTSKVCEDSFQTKVDPRRSFAKETHNTHSVKEKVHLEHGLPRPAGIAKEMENLMPNKQSNHTSTRSCNATASLSGKPPFSENSSGSGDDTQKANHLENRQSALVYENAHLNEAKNREDDSVSNSRHEEDKDDWLQSQNVDTSIINEREKLKETDEYKRAVEEEWASRQKALLIQAEEAQHLRRLRKRRKAESMRLLDMERRQKQRVDEMRNTQKKDEENMNLKEVIRAKVRTELKKLEITCRNMGSLLHSLGIRVGGWPTPSPQEVQAAYKRALLTFHPDRASRSDIRQQVESEEKFKLINRLKEKFPPSI